MGLLSIIGGAFIFAVLTNVYSYYRFIRRVDFLQSYLRYIRYFLAFISIFEFVFVMQIRFEILGPNLYLFGGALIGFSLFLFAVSVSYDALRAIFKKNKFNAKRRKFIKFCFDATFLIIFISFFFKGIFTALTPPKVNKIKIKIKNLASPLRLAVISDIHIGEFLQKEFLATLVYQINSLKPDAVLIIGDLVDLNAKKIGDFLDPLNDLHSRYGTFYVPGNHEYYHGIDEILAKISSLKVQILGNKSVKIGGVNLAGVYDLAGIRFKHLEPDILKATSQVDKNLPTILLSHQPKFIKTIPESVPVDLVICGHTHGGQIFPFGLLVLADQGYLRGLYRLNDKTQAYVSSGAGFWGPPVRIFAPSEIAILDLMGD